jgi:hypothetical protein
MPRKLTKIPKTDLPSQYIKSRLTTIEKEAIEYMVENQNLTEEEAKTILGSDAEFASMMAIAEKKIKVEMMQYVLPKIKEAVELKLERGSLEQAQRGMTAWAIAKDKIFGENTKGNLNIGGKNIQINFDFKPYKK